MIRAIEAARQLYGPSVESMRLSLPDIGSGLDNACCELARDLTLERLDRLSAQLNSAQDNLRHLRLALIEKHGTGIR